MVVRIISAVVGIAILIACLICPYTILLALPAAFLSALSVWELLYNTKIIKNRILIISGMVISAVGVLTMYQAQKLYTKNLLLITDDVQSLLLILLALPILYGLIILVTFVCSQIAHKVGGGDDKGKAMPIENACYAFFLTAYPTIGFGCMVMLREQFHHGIWLLILLVALAWVSDTGAYFVGTFLGKHKMAPKISPKKTWEGFFGGWLISVLFAVGLFALRFELDNAYGNGLFHTLRFYLPVVIILVPLTVVGDLLASLIKRKCDIKDFGNIMPGHGGVMDRFDIVLFISPLLYLITVNAPTIMDRLAGLFNG